MWSFLESVECNASERAVLVSHAALLDNGYRLKRPPHIDTQNGIHLTILPSNWKEAAPAYSFTYEGCDMRALVVGSDININIARGDKLYNFTFRENEQPETWREQINRNLNPKKEEEESSSSQPRQAPRADHRDAMINPRIDPLRDPRFEPVRPIIDPLRDSRFDPLRVIDPRFPEHPSTLVGPNDPRWRPMMDPHRDINPGLQPRFDPIGPGGIGEPDNDILRPTRFGGWNDYM